MKKEDLVEFLKSVYYDGSRGLVDLSELDFGDCSVDISHMKVKGDLYQDWQEVEGDLNKEIAVKIRNENQQLTSPTEKETLYFDARKSEGFENNFSNFSSNHKAGLFDCHGLTKEETEERGYDRHWTSDMFTTEKPKPLKIIDGRVE